MNEVYQELLSPIIYRWILAQSHDKAKQGKCSICFCKQDHHASIYFHKENIIELIIKNKMTQENEFYLHFQMKDIKTTTEHIKVFFRYLQSSPQPFKDPQNISVNQNLKILLCCTSGVTTSYFAYLMQEALGCQNKGIDIDAVSYLEMDEIQSYYDFILLAPQIAYQYPKIREKYGEKVMLIDSMDFATGNANRVLYKIMNHH